MYTYSSNKPQDKLDVIYLKRFYNRPVLVNFLGLCTYFKIFKRMFVSVK